MRLAVPRSLAVADEFLCDQVAVRPNLRRKFQPWVHHPPDMHL